MLDQLGRHSGVDLAIKVEGDLHIDEHHTIEDTGIALGEAISLALGNKKGVARYGFTLPMDDALAQVALDFGGRSWLVWTAEFKREKIGAYDTDMTLEFLRAIANNSESTIHIDVLKGKNDHHITEAIFKSLGLAIKQAITVVDGEIFSTKGKVEE